jgi:hypothetical protein
MFRDWGLTWLDWTVLAVLAVLVFVAAAFA